MKSTRALKAAGLVLIAVVLGMLTVQGSYALWNKSVSSNVGTIQAADFRITLTDTITTQTTDMTVGGNAATLSLSTKPLGPVTPGEAAYAGVQVGNVTNAGGNFTVRASTATRVINNNNNLALYLRLKVVAATSLSQCDQAALYASAIDTATVDIAKGGSSVFCFQLSLSADMPAEFSKQTATVSIPITVTQL